MMLIQNKKNDIFYRRWSAQEPQVVLLLIHGLGAHTGRWEFLGDFFQKNNISSYALELKGFGQTQGERGDIDSLNTYFQDMRSLSDIIKRENPGKDIFLLGESMGALICFLYAALEPQAFSGLICISPAFANKLPFSLWTYLNIGLALIFNPKRYFPVPIAPEMCTRDLEYQKIIEADPLDKHTATARLYWNILKAQKKVGSLGDKINIPFLVLTAGEDRVVDSLAAREIFNSLRIKDKKLINYPAMRHALSIESGREKIFGDILGWIGRSEQ
ncbi:MAG: lysophospholipase [Candidatus Omnitrophota bacterium]